MTSSTLVKDDPILDRDAFLAERQNYIGGSEVAAVLGLDTNKTRLELYNEKVGLTEPFAGNKHSQRGQKLEDTAAREFMDVTGKTVRRDRRTLIHSDYPFIRGHLDRRIQGTKRPLELKCPSRGMFYKVQREGLQNSWIMQGQTYMLLDGAEVLEWGVFCADAWECIPFEQKADSEIQQFIIREVVTFWNENVLPRVPPKPTKLDNEIAALATQVGGDVIRRTDQEFIEAAQLLREAAALKSDGEMLYDLAKQRCIDSVNGEIGRYEGGGVRLYYMEQNGRKTFDKKLLASVYPEINLAEFEKQGAPFKTFRPYFIGGE